MTNTVMSLKIPAIPDVILKRFESSLVTAINTLATKITQTANSNEMRLYLFQEASRNNWNNPYFIRICDLVRLHISATLAYHEQYNFQNFTVNAEIDKTLENIVEFLSTDILMSLPQFSYRINNGDIYSKADNIIKFMISEVNVSISKLNNYMAYLSNNMSNKGVSPLTLSNSQLGANSYNRQPAMLDMVTQSNLVNNPSITASRYTNDVTLKPSDFIKSADVGSNASYRENLYKPNEVTLSPSTANQVVQTAINNRAHTPQVTSKDWKTTPTNPYLTLLTINQERYFEVINGVVTERIKEKGIRMDRKAHCLVGNINLDSEQRVAKVNKLTDQHLGSLREKDEVKRRAKINDFVDTSYLITDSLESGLVGLRVKLLTNNDNINKNTYFKYYLLVCSSYPDKYSYTNFLDELSACSGFASMASLLTSFIDQAKTAVDKTDEDKTRLMIYLSGINSYLTNFINRFLSNGLGIDVKIDSFMIDMASLEAHIQNNYGSIYVGAYRDFEFTTSQCVLKPDVDKEEITSFFSDEIELGVHINYVPESYTISFVNLFLSELGLETMEYGKPYAITRDKNSMLYNIAAANFKGNNDPLQVAEAMKHIVMTVDNASITLSKSFLGRDLYVATVEK